MEDNIEDLIKDIESAIGGFQSGLDIDLANYMAQLKDHMIGGEFKSQTGDLRSSMKAKLINDYAIQISMIYYGYFLAFGVDIKGKTGKKTFGVNPEVANALNVAGRGRKIANNGSWKFGQASESKRIFGINARGTSSPAPGSNSNTFYPDEVIEELKNILIKNTK